MERKNFLRNGLLLLGGGGLILEACKKSGDAAASTTGTGGTGSTDGGSCVVMPTETEGPYPYPGGEINNPLNRSDVTGGQTGLPLVLTFGVVNVNNNCAYVSNARVDIWACNKDGYYSGYSQQGYLGTKNYAGETWLRGYQETDANGQARFTTIYPGWYSGRATHIHLEVFVNNVLKKTGQITFDETISDAVHASSLYAAHGINTTRNARDGVFGDSAADLARETVALTGSLSAGYTGTYNIGIAL
ncbi:MAG: intradiol ring-cleavage dioxygenase [Candidatus Pseudobacter hemicellulosilyticus]|uniref:Intradiol ring-cleavage dioxygenase n=1 Tax=Candidatus Pseudobacter hemicellulosilyticus TaxID=3121375 RepID=A0AAJ5WTC2_9BACT|nr:MAG: intradiol ring-cleavage dioxygenase [Pseudobacter sp.]